MPQLLKVKISSLSSKNKNAKEQRAYLFNKLFIYFLSTTFK